MSNHISQRNGIIQLLYSLLFHIQYKYIFYLINSIYSPQSSLVLSPIPTPTTTKRPTAGILLPVQTISRPPSNPLTSTVGHLTEINSNMVDGKQCGQQEISTGTIEYNK